jgi:hypothetical protein
VASTNEEKEKKSAENKNCGETNTIKVGCDRSFQFVEMIAVLLALCCATALVTAIPIAAPTNNHLTTPQESTWVQLANGPWSAREGLMAVTAPEGIYLSGGRDRFGATAIRDVWFSSNGSTWTQMPLPPWVARSYHAMFYQV